MRSKRHSMKNLIEGMVLIWGKGHKIAKYTQPKLKAVECHSEEDWVVNVIVKRFDFSLE